MQMALTACAGASGVGPLLLAAGCGSKPLLRDEDPLLADLHMHTMINLWNRRSPLFVEFPILPYIAEKGMNTSGMAWEDCHKAGVDLLCVTHFSAFDEWLSMPTDPNPEAPINTLRMMDQLEAELAGPAAPYARLARNHHEMSKLLEVLKNREEYRIAVVHTVEGGHALGGDLGAIETFARRGVALITVTHFFNKGVASAANSYPFFPDAGARWDNQGLTCFGRDVIQEMESCGVLVDITHAPAAAVADILSHAKKPLVATHVSARTLSDHPYSLYDEHIEEIALKNKGIIGIIIDPYLLSNYVTIGHAEREGTLRQVVRTIRHVVKLCGDQNVGIGSDFAGYITPPEEMKRISRIGFLKDMLLNEFGRRTTEDILANNVIRYLKDNWQSGL
jgi:membrane dipeptidase